MKNQNSITINEKEILIFSENGENYIAVRPICEALGVDFKSQYDKLKSDPILSSVVVLSTTTGGDKKSYQMVVLPYKFIFGWLFTINENNVKAEAKDALVKYKLECYDALYDHFTNRSKMIARKAEKLHELRSLQNKLAVNEDFQKMLALREEISKISREATQYDKNEIDIRLSLFDDENQ